MRITESLIKRVKELQERKLKLQERLQQLEGEGKPTYEVKSELQALYKQIGKLSKRIFAYRGTANKTGYFVVRQELQKTKQLQGISKLLYTNVSESEVYKVLTKASNAAVARLNIADTVITKAEVKDTFNSTNAVIQAFNRDVSEAKEDNTFASKEAQFKRRAALIQQCEGAKVVNWASEAVAKKEGFSKWLWGPSSSIHPRSSHLMLYGKKSPIGQTPEAQGYFPGEAPNCNCQMIFVKD